MENFSLPHWNPFIYRTRTIILSNYTSSETHCVYWTNSLFTIIIVYAPFNFEIIKIGSYYDLYGSYFAQSHYHSSRPEQFTIAGRNQIWDYVLNIEMVCQMLMNKTENCKYNINTYVSFLPIEISTNLNIVGWRWLAVVMVNRRWWRYVSWLVSVWAHVVRYTHVMWQGRFIKVYVFVLIIPYSGERNVEE